MEEKYQRSWNHFTCALVIDPSKLQPNCQLVPMPIAVGQF